MSSGRGSRPTLCALPAAPRSRPTRMAEWTPPEREGGVMYDRILARFAFAIPDLYRAMAAAGLFASRGVDALFLTDLEWLTPEEMGDFESPDYQVRGLVPFAKSARGDLWC